MRTAQRKVRRDAVQHHDRVAHAHVFVVGEACAERTKERVVPPQHRCLVRAPGERRVVAGVRSAQAAPAQREARQVVAQRIAHKSNLARRPGMRIAQQGLEELRIVTRFVLACAKERLRDVLRKQGIVHGECRQLRRAERVEQADHPRCIQCIDGREQRAWAKTVRDELLSEAPAVDGAAEPVLLFGRKAAPRALIGLCLRPELGAQLRRRLLETRTRRLFQVF